MVFARAKARNFVEGLPLSLFRVEARVANWGFAKVFQPLNKGFPCFSKLLDVLLSHAYSDRPDVQLSKTVRILTFLKSCYLFCGIVWTSSSVTSLVEINS